MPSIVLGTTFVGPNAETFRVLDYLDSGAFGEVYRAVGTESASIVAVKLLPLGELSSDESRTALLNEVRVAQQIKHPNVVQVLAVNDGSSSPIGPYVVMEYVSGGSLAKLLRKQEQSGIPLPLDRAVAMMIGLAQGARAINEKIIHRDIKPDNVLIEGEALKIGDFGISKFVDESTRLQTFKGIQHCAYMAPESWQGDSNTIKIDVYSVGLIFYQILGFKHPLQRYVNDPDNFLDWRNAHLFDSCPDIRILRSEVPLTVAQLLLRMVSKHPGERPYWDETLNLLSQPGTATRAKDLNITAAVEAALARKREKQKLALQAMKAESNRETQLGLYRYSCAELLAQLEPPVEQFNQEFQDGKITRRTDGAITIYDIPEGKSISVHFFRPPEIGVRTNVGEIIGGGWIGLSHGRSANLMLVKDDSYGIWKVCEMKASAIIQPAMLIGKFGLAEGTIMPFGLSGQHFFEQIQFARGPVHILSYEFNDSPGQFFSRLLCDAYQT